MACFSAWFLQLVALFIIFVLYLYWRFGTGLDYWRKKGAHYLRPTLIFGNIKDVILMRKSDAEVYQKLYIQLDGLSYGGIFQMNKPALIVRNPELIKEVMVKDFGSFHDRNPPVDEKASPLNATLFSLTGQRWRKLRMKLTPTFTSGKIKSMFPILAECAQQMLENLEKNVKQNNVIEMKEVIAQMTTDIIGSCAFGLQVNSINDPNSEWRQFFKKILAPTVGARIRFLLATIFPFLIKVLRKLRGRETEKFFLGAIGDTVKYREDNNIQRNDFLQLLIQLKNKGKVEGTTMYSKDDAYLEKSFSDKTTDDAEDEELVLTDNLLAAQCIIFFVGGFETSSSAASYCLHELALNPDIQERLRDEVDSVLIEYDGKITYEAIQKMKYLERVVDETLRKYPPLGKLDRITTKPFKLPGTDVTIEKGVPIIIPIYALHRDPKYFPDPERFDPERFSDESKACRPQFTYLPFGEGPRICIGMRFGLLQTKVGLAALLSRYIFSASHKTCIPLIFEPKANILSAKGGIWLKVIPRSM